MGLTKFDKASVIVLNDCLRVKKEEKVLVITDENKREIGYSLYRNARRLGYNSLFVEMKSLKTNGEEPPKEIAGLMKKFDVVICPTTKSLTHTNARRNASAKGARIVTMPGITKEIMIRCVDADYIRIAAMTIKISHLMDKTNLIRITTKLGTEITLDITNRKAIPGKGLFYQKGDAGNLPAGEAFAAPIEGKSYGIFFVDGSMAGIGMIDKTPIKIEVKDGLAVNINGDYKAKKLIKILKPFGKKGENIAEIGIGTNYKAKLSGNILEDEKVLGTCHIALGNNKSMGGKVNVPIHIDGVIKKPTIYFDNKIIMKDGKLLV